MLEHAVISGFADEIDGNTDRQIAVLEKLGIGCVEFRSGDGKGVADYTLEEAKQLKEKLDAHGLSVSAVGSPIGKINITDPFEPHLEKLRHVAQLAHIWDTPYIRMFSFFIPEGQEPETYRDEVMRRMEAMVACARREEVVLLHENEKDIYGDTASRCLDLMKNFYGEHFRCTFDFANFVQCRQDTMEAYEMLKPYIEYVHIKDAVWDTGEVVPAGQGDGKVEAILGLLDQTGYRGYLSLEPHLAEFQGLKELEKNAAQRKMSDGEKAYTMAWNALKVILGRQ